MKMKKTGKTRRFTLIEICIAVALLGMLAGIVGWHLIKMADLQRFRKSVGLFVTNLQKLQIIALSRRCDLVVHIMKKEGQYFYRTISDEPLFLSSKNCPVLLKGVYGLSRSGRPVSEVKLIISPSGQIEPLEKIGFFPNDTQASSQEEGAIWLDLRVPLQVKCRDSSMQSAAP